ncbi:MAG TPA: cyanophycin synthetase [Blastocatellia bacterium]|nr:cyanophycin synthetase [Blastocatellia bacterium]
MLRPQKKSRRKVASIERKTFVSEILSRIAPRIGAKVFLEPDYGFVGEITFTNGKRVLFRDRNFNINPQGSSEIARDKGYADFFLKHYGYNTVEGQTFFSEKLNDRLEIRRTIDDGFQYAKTLGLPVILKPNNLSQGTLVTKVHNKREYYLAAKKILKRTPVMLVQRFYSGNDYRLVVLDNEVISAYQRTALFVVGDGKSTVTELLKLKQRNFVKLGRDTEIDADDFRIRLKLLKMRLTCQSVPTLGAKVVLLDNANLSTGGDAFDVSAKVHPDFCRLAVTITKDMGLRMCGVDIITGDIKTTLDRYVVIEINSAPGLDNYASIGAKQRERVDELYLRVLQALETS